jgi:hypothetical protein
MTDNDKRGAPTPLQEAKIHGETERRRARQAAALRENLRRRKERARDGADTAAPAREPEPRS